MVGKKMEGNEEQRRAAGRAAKRQEKDPSDLHETTGASKQPSHLTGRRSVTHEERVATLHQGKQQDPDRLDERRMRPEPAPEPERNFRERGAPRYSDAHEQVFSAVSTLEAREGRGPFLDEIAREADMERGKTRALLRDLATVHRLVTELQGGGGDTPDQGTRFEVKPRV
ncbi:hypothetical protein [Streptomyces sp. TP-A0874]|uniref:hypothetical protein n=1 Tax=Streptomyces sp. TP-A0874 TaxID=549819 RepID=UPI000853E5BC|nr:hypothetical protein [Streptomyces sp. TP-A0874]